MNGESVRPHRIVSALLETDNVQLTKKPVVVLETGPSMQTLKDNRVELDDDERKQVMRAGAVWHHGKNGKPSPAVWKSEVRGKTYYVCNTHRTYQAKTTLRAAIRAFDFVKTTA